MQLWLKEGSVKETQISTQWGSRVPRAKIHRECLAVSRGEELSQLARTFLLARDICTLRLTCIISGRSFSWWCHPVRYSILPGKRSVFERKHYFPCQGKKRELYQKYVQKSSRIPSPSRLQLNSGDWISVKKLWGWKWTMSHVSLCAMVTQMALVKLNGPYNKTKSHESRKGTDREDRRLMEKEGRLTRMCWK